MVFAINRTLWLLLCCLIGQNVLAQTPATPPVIINEVYFHPAGGIDNNSSYVVSPPCAANMRAKEWIELYNPSPCQAVDISCYVIGCTLGTTDTTAFSCENGNINFGWLTIPAGTTIPPMGYLTIGGKDADVPVDFAFANHVGTRFFVGSPRFFLNSSAGWLVLYPPQVNRLVDAVYWTQSDRNEYRTSPIYKSNYVLPPVCGRTGNITIPTGEALINGNTTQMKYAGNSGVDQGSLNLEPRYIQRLPDGGCWTPSRNENGTSKATNARFPLPQRPFIETPVGGIACNGKPLTLKNTYNPAFECPLANTVYTIRYQWFGNGRLLGSQANFTGTATAGMTYTLVVTINGCTFTDTAKVNIITEPRPSFVVKQDLKCERQDIEFTYTGETYDGATYTWNFEGGTPATATGIGPHTVIWKKGDNKIAKKVSVTLQVASNCQATFNGTIVVNEAPKGQHVSNLKEVCQGGPVIISVKDLEANAEVFDWDFNGGLATPTPGKPNTFSVLWWESGMKKVTAKVKNPNNPCIGLPDTVFVEVKPVPIAEMSVYAPPPGVCDAVTIDYSGFAPPGSQYFWNVSGAEVYDSILKKVVPKVIGAGPHKIRWYDFGHKEISVYVIARGCTSNVYKTTVEFNPYYLNVAFMDVPNAFSPNGDGNNDFYELVNLRGECAKYSMEIFTRWGDKVFEIPRNADRWDGTIYGQPAAEGAYTYKLTIEVIGNKPVTRSGTITLIR